MSMLDLSGYVATDPFFGSAYVDLDEERATPVPHRFVHGGFEGTSTRFSFSFPTDGSYQGRLLQPLEGAHGGHENAFGSELVGDMIGGLRMTARLGAFMAESNQGHIGDDLDPDGRRRPHAVRAPGQRRGGPPGQGRRRPSSTDKNRITPTSGAAAAADAGHRCAWRTVRGCGTAPCPSWAAARSSSTATPTRSRAHRPCRSPRCSIANGSWATRCCPWPMPWPPAAMATRSRASPHTSVRNWPCSTRWAFPGVTST